MKRAEYREEVFGGRRPLEFPPLRTQTNHGSCLSFVLASDKSWRLFKFCAGRFKFKILYGNIVEVVEHASLKLRGVRRGSLSWNQKEPWSLQCGNMRLSYTAGGNANNGIAPESFHETGLFQGKSKQEF